MVGSALRLASLVPRHLAFVTLDTIGLWWCTSMPAAVFVAVPGEAVSQRRAHVLGHAPLLASLLACSLARSLACTMQAFDQARSFACWPACSQKDGQRPWFLVHQWCIGHGVWCLVQCATVFYSILEHFTVYSTVFYSILQHTTAFYNILQYSTVF